MSTKRNLPKRSRKGKEAEIPTVSKEADTCSPASNEPDIIHSVNRKMESRSGISSDGNSSDTFITAIDKGDLTYTGERQNVLPLPFELRYAPIGESSGDIVISESGNIFAEIIKLRGPSFINDIFDDWMNNGIIKQINSTPIVLDENHIVRATQINILEPSINWDNKNIKMYPARARLNKITYAADLYVTMVETDISGRDALGNIIYRDVEGHTKRIKLAKVPIPLGSQYCHLHGKSDEQKKLLGELPQDPLSYFIGMGKRRSVLNKEKLAVNRIALYMKKTLLNCTMTINTPRGSTVMTLNTTPSSEAPIIRMQISALGKNEKNATNSINVIQLFRMMASGGSGADSYDFTDINQLAKFISSFIFPEQNRSKSMRQFVATIIDSQAIKSTVSNFDVNEALDSIITDIYKAINDNILSLGNDFRLQFANDVEVMEADNEAEFSIRLLGAHTLIDKYKDYMDLSYDTYKKRLSSLNDRYDTPITPDVEFIAKMKGIDDAKNSEKQRIVDEIIDHDLFPNYGTSPKFRWYKLSMLAIMTARVLEFLAGYRPLDDRDSWANKRLESAGRIMEFLFRSEYNKLVKGLTDEIARGTIKTFGNAIDYLVGDKNTISDGFNDIITKGTYGSSNSRKSFVNVSQTVPTNNLATMHSILRRVDVDINENDRQTSIRAVQGSQLNKICPFETPEGGKAGLIKNLAALATLSLRMPERPLMEYIENKLSHLTNIVYKIGWNPLMINGRFLGWCKGVEFVDSLRLARNRGVFDKHTSIVHDNYYVYIHTDGSRILSPYFVVVRDYMVNSKMAREAMGLEDYENDDTIIGKLLIDVKNAWHLSFADLLAGGYVEYIDTYEDLYIELATSVNALREYNTYIVQEPIRVGILHAKKKRYVNALNNERWDIVSEIDMSDDMENTLNIDDPEWEEFNSQLSEVMNPEQRKELFNLKKKLMDENNKAHGNCLSDAGCSNGVCTKGNKSVNVDVTPKEALEMAPAAKFTGFSKSIDKSRLTLGEKAEMLKRFIDKLDAEIRQREVKLGQIKRKKPHTHCLIDPQSILGVIAALNPAGNHNPAPRNTFQSAMSKQALSNMPIPWMEGAEGAIKTLLQPTRPVFEPMMFKTLGMDTYPTGRSVSVGFSTNTGFAIEDGFLFNEDSVNRGLFRIEVRKTYTETAGVSNSYHDVFELPKKLTRAQKEGIYKNIGRDGLPAINSYIVYGDVIISKIRKSGNNETPKPVTLMYGEYGFVKNVKTSCNGKGRITVYVELAIVRWPIVGDKFEARYSQKGTIGKIIPKSEMPHDENGWSPDIIINPHSFTSRMTTGYFIEVIASMAGVITGRRVDASPFSKIDVNSYTNILDDYGFKSDSTRQMYSGITGELLESRMYTGFCYFQALCHHVADKARARGFGPINPVTGQAVKNRVYQGGIKFGEMESHAIYAHGASAFLQERMKKVADEVEVLICRSCGTTSYYDVKNDAVMECRICGNKQFGLTSMPMSMLHFESILSITGVKFSYLTSTDDQRYLTTNKGKFMNQDEDIEDIEDEDEDEDEEDDEEDDVDAEYDDIDGDVF